MAIVRLEDKCTLCMLCVQDCVSGVWREVGNIPTVIAPDLCNRCSHCVAICPAGAIKHDTLDAAQVRRIDKKMLDPDVYREIVRSRRSIRHYEDKSVPGEIIQNIIDLSAYSPSASNDQNIQYIVVTDKLLIKKISKYIFNFISRVHNLLKTPPLKIIVKMLGKSENRYLKLMDYTREQTKTGRDFFLHHAPVLILLNTPKRANFACDNCNIAATNIINYANAMGLGTCYIGFLVLLLRFSRKLRKWLDVPKGRRVHVSLVMGYPAISHTFTVSRKKRDVKWLSRR